MSETLDAAPAVKENEARSSSPAVNGADKDTAMEDVDANDVAADKTEVVDDANAPEDADADSTSADAKGKAKRKSAGVPEHRVKKPLGKKKSTATLAPQPDPDVGDYRLGRVRGYPPWPCIIVEDSMLPENLILKRPIGAKRADGSYKGDYVDGAKKEHERSFPVLFLHTNDLMWIQKNALDPLDDDALEAGPQNLKKKDLVAAFAIAEDKPDLQYFKDVLADHERAKAEKAAKSSKAKKAKKEKVEKTVDEMDVDEEEEEEEELEEPESDEGKKSRKRKKADDSDGEGEKKTAKRKKSVKDIASGIKLKISNLKGEKKEAKPKKSKKAAKEEKPAPTPEEIQAQKDKAVLWFRHQLQRRFLNVKQTPTDEDVKIMDECITKLENSGDLEASTIRNTKIHKVIRAILKLPFIPKDEDYNFKDRAHKLLLRWKPVLDETEAQDQKAATNGVKHDDDAKEKSDADVPKPASPAEKPTDADKEVKIDAQEELKKADESTETEIAPSSVKESELQNGEKDVPLETLKAAEPVEAS